MDALVFGKVFKHYEFMKQHLFSDSIRFYRVIITRPEIVL